MFRFFSDEWPRLFWSLKEYVFISAAVFFLCTLVGTLITLKNYDFALQVLGPQMIDKIDHRQMWTDSIVGMKPVASSSITTNNMTVAFMTFALGITGAVGTLYMLAFNGLLIGVVGTACATHGMGLQLFSFVAGHGSLEIPAILIAGAAGLRIGAGLLFPGQYSRRDSLLLAGGEAVKLELGTIPLLLVAGLVEGFISPTAIPVGAKFSLGAALFIALCVWILSGKTTATASSSASLRDTDSKLRLSGAAH